MKHHELAPDSFLGAVAEAYLSRYDDLSEFCFIFPNRRSGSFFLRRLAENLGDRPILAPDVMGVDEFMASVADRLAASRLDLIFRLYHIYCRLAGRSDSLLSESEALDFDRFAPWGDMLLADFSEVEKYDVDAPALFRNVKDYREIAANFLTEEQIEIITRYFGVSPRMGDVERFWRNVGPEEERSDIREKFVELWKILPELYSSLIDDLEQDGLALDGSLFRMAMRRVIEEGREALPWKKIVVVGFNHLSTTESRLFSELKKFHTDSGDAFADFFWDCTGPVLNSGQSRAASSLRRYMRSFKSPEWAIPFLMKCETDSMPSRIIMAASPSNTAQTKIASMMLEDWRKSDASRAEEDINKARIAVVLPDENLLLHAMHSLPDNIGSVNITMGFSLRFTSVASFVYHLRQLQLRRRRLGDGYGYHYDDITAFMAHPLMHLLLGSNRAMGVGADMMARHIRIISVEELVKYAPELKDMVTPMNRRASASQTAEWLDSVLQSLEDALSSESDMLNVKMERQLIAAYRMALARLLSALQMNKVEMTFVTLFHLVDRLVQGERVSFDGRPLEGLQIMGLLETRALDFDRVIILSMNDKIMPRRARKRTFIPDALRRGYGLPTSSLSEDLYAYYFYRLISRASEVALIYDARAGEGMRSGGKSRYLLQLDMLHASDLLEHRDYTFRMGAQKSQPEGVTKTPDVMQRVNNYLASKGNKNISASALMTYCQCPVRFYYREVVGLRDEAAPSDTLDAITTGLVVHDVMENVYLQSPGQEKYLKDPLIVTPDLIKTSIADIAGIEALVRSAINRKHYKLKPSQAATPLKGSMILVAEKIRDIIIGILRHDLHLAPFRLIGTEIAESISWSIGDSPVVNAKYSIDRVDEVNGRVRIVDYKTGSSHVAARSPENVFDGSDAAKYMLQLLLYSRFLEDRMKREEGRDVKEIEMVIYDVNHPDDMEQFPKIANKKVTHHRSPMVEDLFDTEMQRILTEIFDPELPFSPTENEDNCRYCNLRDLCGRH